ncbi:MAG: conjugal transfer protein TraX [Clostridia bacterium]|nr:conjugal transfer protein TraX [Clostridia bacterium]
MKKTLNSNIIKLIAIIAMTIDHIAWAVFPGYSTEIVPIIMHIIGRITCPIMCYFVAEGFFHTKDINKYTCRLFVFAVISHFAYVFASADFIDLKSFIPFYYGRVLNQTSVMWSLAWGLVMLRVANSTRLKQALKTVIIILICLISFPSDWSCIASLCVLAFGTNRGNLKAQALWMIFYVAIYSIVYFFALDKLYGVIQMAVVLAVPVIMTYNGQRGKDARINKFIKWAFYVYYPVHLALIGIVQSII